MVWDVKVAFNDVPGDTISELIRDLGHAWYSLPYIMGVVMGHLFWNRAPAEMREPKEHLRVFFLYVGGSSALMLTRDVVNHFVGLPAFTYANLILVVIGFAVGATWWPQALPEEGETE